MAKPTREQILDAALGCLGRYGFRRTSMETIAEAAGVSRQTVYQHFAGKGDVFRAVGQRMLDAARAEAEAAAASEAGLADRLYRVLTAKLSLVAGHTGSELRAEVLADAETLAADLLMSFGDALAAILVGILADADELDLAGAGMSAHDVAALLLDATSGIVRGQSSVSESQRRLRQLVDLTVNGLGHREPAT